MELQKFTTKGEVLLDWFKKKKQQQSIEGDKQAFSSDLVSNKKKK